MTAPLTLPSTFGRYRLLRKLGEGGMGAVYVAEDTVLARQVALKMPLLKGSEAVQRFLREARIAASIHHANLCPVHDVGQHDGVYYLTMPLLEGTPLSHYAGRAWPLRQAVELVRRLAGALVVLHEHDLMHRDLKPGNIMVQADGTPVLLDFGLARSISGVDRMTRSGAQLGTPSYMAPEQINGDAAQLGPTTDVWSLGVILYELLTGQLPFQAPNLAALYHQIFSLDPAAPSSLRPEGDGALDAIVARALAKEVAGRYRSMAEFGAALDAWLQRVTLTAPPALPALAAGELRMVCPQCGKRLKLPATAWGKKVKCPGCQARMAVPSDQETRLPPAALVTGVAVPAVPPLARPAASVTRPAPVQSVVLWVVGGVAILFTGLFVGWLLFGGRSPRGEGIAGRSTQPVKAGEKPDTLSGKPPPPAAATEAEMPKSLQAPFSAAQGKAAQQAWAQYLGKQVEETIDLGGGVQLVVVLIPPGTYTMGSPNGEAERFDDEQLHTVTLTQPFYLGKYAVTQAEYVRVTGKANPSYFSSTGSGKDRVASMDTSRFPVEQVSHKDAEDFCTALGKKLGPGWVGAALPTEAQWEYACRAGTTTRFYVGDNLGKDQANFGTNPGRTVTVGQGVPNAFSLWDMHGNVWQWCSDWYGPYPAEAQIDPKGPLQSSGRVRRGGGWSFSATYCRSADRYRVDPSDRLVYLGFRAALVPSGVK